MLTNLDALETSLETPIEETANPILSFRRSHRHDADERADLAPNRAQRVYLPIRRVIDFSLKFRIEEAAHGGKNYPFPL